MKTCPRCGALAFDDATTCEGCKHEFASPEPTHAEVMMHYLRQRGYASVRMWSCECGDYVVARDGRTDVVVKVVIDESDSVIPELAAGDDVRQEMLHAMLHLMEGAEPRSDVRADVASVSLRDGRGKIRHLVGMCGFEMGEDGEMTCW